VELLEVDVVVAGSSARLLRLWFTLGWVYVF
jgi:hypothetical protein